MKKILIGSSMLGLIGGGAVACSEVTDEVIDTKTAGFSLEFQRQVDSRATVVRASGKPLTYVRDVSDNSPESEWLRREAENARAAASVEALDETSRTRRELAEAYRGVSLIDGKEYIDAEPNWRVADLILESRHSKNAVPDFPSNTEEIPPESLEGHRVFDTDDRIVQRANTSYPFSTQVVFVNGDGYRCSGTMVGPSTMLTAAHCFHTGSGWRNTSVSYYFGADRRDGNSSIIDSADYVTYTGCWDATISQDFFNGNTSEHNDHAVVDFGSRCNFYPGYSAGWLGVWAADDHEIEDEHLYIYGYPGVNCPGNDCFWPSIWGHGSDWAGVKSSTSFKSRTDTGDGQSGAGVYRIYQGNRYLIGIHKGDNWNAFHSGWHNHGRRVTVWLIGWMEDNSLYDAPNSAYSYPSQ